jgi:signal transduction histidine kinase
MRAMFTNQPDAGPPAVDPPPPGGEARLRQLADQERLRLVHEVHDLVGHGLTVISMHAGVALHLAQESPGQAEAALATIKATCETVLAELRGALEVFRHPDACVPTAGLDQLGDLAEAMRSSGLAVELDVAGQRPPLTAAAELAAYRIVQESLTNVLRHAGRVTATVRVRYSAVTVTLEIVDDGDTPAGETAATRGYGITGMRERAAALGGTLEAGPHEGGGFRVLAKLPNGMTTSHKRQATWPGLPDRLVTVSRNEDVADTPADHEIAVSSSR